MGWRGIMDPDEPPKRPDKFPSMPGEVFPIYHVLRQASDFLGGHVQRLGSSAELSAIGLALQRGDRKRLLIANLTDRRQVVVVEGLDAAAGVVSLLDGQSLPLASKDPEVFWSRPGRGQALDQPIVLPPHALARIDH